MRYRNCELYRKNVYLQDQEIGIIDQELEVLYEDAKRGLLTKSGNGEGLDAPLVSFLKVINRSKEMRTIQSCMGHIITNEDGKRSIFPGSL